MDDFIIAGKGTDPRWRKAKENLKRLYKWGNGSKTPPHFAELGTSRRVTTLSRWTNRTSLENSSAQTSRDAQELVQDEWEDTARHSGTQTPERDQWFTAVAGVKHAHRPRRKKGIVVSE